MFHSIWNSLVGLTQSKLRNAAAAAAMLGAVPTAVFAHHRPFHLDIVVPAPEVVVPAAPCNAPVARVWVPAVYQTVTQRVWVEGVTTTQVKRVEVPAEYGYRDVIVYDYFGRAHRRQQLVEISPAHCEERTVTVVVSPGHFEDQTRQQLVSEGHWQMVGETQVQQPLTVVEPATARLEIPLPF